MALIKEHITKYGIKASYWRVEMITLNYNKQRTEVNFSFKLYFEKDAEEFIETYYITELMGNQNPELLQLFIENADIKNVRKTCYEFAKEHIPFFADALDDPDEIKFLRD